MILVNLLPNFNLSSPPRPTPSARAHELTSRAASQYLLIKLRRLVRAFILLGRISPLVLQPSARPPVHPSNRPPVHRRTGAANSAHLTPRAVFPSYAYLRVLRVPPPPPRALFIHHRLPRCPSPNSSRPLLPPPLHHRSISVQRISHISFLFFIVPFSFFFSAARKNLVTDNNLTLTDAVQRSHI